ncbi:hypothetical protein ADL03_34780 [Nocardia sp. NRRL S-836]|nr:hypothetical protein ADL03_34780 [Nocardia sp. NRRL S-836]
MSATAASQRSRGSTNRSFGTNGSSRSGVRSAVPLNETSRKSRTTAAAPASRTSVSRCGGASATHVAPAATAEVMPLTASSNTTHRSTGTPSRRAASA